MSVLYVCSIHGGQKSITKERKDHKRLVVLRDPERPVFGDNAFFSLKFIYRLAMVVHVYNLSI